MTVICSCKKWKKGIRELNNVVEFCMESRWQGFDSEQDIIASKNIPCYTVGAFKYCPWCGKLLTLINKEE